MLVGLGLAVLVFGDTIDGLMLGLSGWLLGSASRSITRRLAVQDLIEDVRVDDVVDRTVSSVSAAAHGGYVCRAADGRGRRLRAPGRAGRQGLIGVIGSAQLRRIGRRAWPTTRAEDVMVGPPSMSTLAPGR